jgi:hypothetical protein
MRIIEIILYYLIHYHVQTCGCAVISGQDMIVSKQRVIGTVLSLVISTIELVCF